MVISIVGLTWGNRFNMIFKPKNIFLKNWEFLQFSLEGTNTREKTKHLNSEEVEFWTIVLGVPVRENKHLNKEAWTFLA